MEHRCTPFAEELANILTHQYGDRDCPVFSPEQIQDFLILAGQHVEKRPDSDTKRPYLLPLSYDELVILDSAFDVRREELCRLMNTRQDERNAWDADLEKLENLEERIDALLDKYDE